MNCLFTAGHGNALNKLLLEDQVQDHHGDHGQQAACHQHREVGSVLTVQGRKAGRQGHHVQIGVADQRPHQVGISEHRRKDGQCRHAGAGQRQHDLDKGLPLVTAVQIRRLCDLVGDAQIRLPQKEGAEGADQTGEHQRKDGVGGTHLCQHLVLRNNEDLARQHHLDQHQTEQQLFAGEFQFGKGIACHGAEHHRKDHTEQDQQTRIDVEVGKGQALQCLDKAVQIPMGGQDLRRDRHRLRLRLEAGEHHPYKGEDHADAAEDQDQIGKERYDILSGFQTGIHSLHLVIDPLLLTDELHQGDQTDQQHGPHHNGRCVALIAGNKALAVEQVHQALCAGQRRVRLLHHHVDQIVDLQGSHQPHNEHHKQGGRHHGQRNAEELADLGCTVQLGGFVQGLGNVLDAGQQQHGIVADGAPDGNDGTGDQNDLGVGQPADVRAKDLIQNAILRIEDPLPDHCNRSRSHHHGQEEDGAEGGLALDLCVQQHCHDQRQKNAHRHSEDAEVDGVPVCLPEFRIAEHFKVVFQTAELVCSKGFRLGKTHVDGLEERDNIQDHQTEDGGSYHDQPPETPIPAQL